MVYFPEYSKKSLYFSKNLQGIFDHKSTNFLYMQNVWSLNKRAYFLAIFKSEPENVCPNQQIGCSTIQNLKFYSYLIVQRNYFSRIYHEHTKTKCVHFQSIWIWNFCLNVKCRMKTWHIILQSCKVKMKILQNKSLSFHEIVNRIWKIQKKIVAFSVVVVVNQSWYVTNSKQICVGLGVSIFLSVSTVNTLH